MWIYRSDRTIFVLTENNLQHTCPSASLSLGMVDSTAVNGADYCPWGGYTDRNVSNIYGEEAPRSNSLNATDCD